MTTLTLDKRFTVQVGDHLVDLPEADTRNEALRKAGLTPRLWQEKPATLRHASKGKAIRANKPHSTTHKTKKTQPRITVSKKVVNKQKTVTVIVTKTPKFVIRNANCNANYCLFCWKPVQGRKSKHYCNGKCRVAAFRKTNN